MHRVPRLLAQHGVMVSWGLRGDRRNEVVESFCATEQLKVPAHGSATCAETPDPIKERIEAWYHRPWRRSSVSCLSLAKHELLRVNRTSSPGCSSTRGTPDRHIPFPIKRVHYEADEFVREVGRRG